MGGAEFDDCSFAEHAAGRSQAGQANRNSHLNGAGEKFGQLASRGLPVRPCLALWLVSLLAPILCFFAMRPGAPTLPVSHEYRRPGRIVKIVSARDRPKENSEDLAEE